MEDKNETITAAIKGAAIWFATVLGNMTLSRWVLLATLVYTALQVYVLVRDKIWNKEPK